CCRQLHAATTDEAILAALDLVEHLVEAEVSRLHPEVVRVASGQAVISCSASEPLVAFDVRAEPEWDRVDLRHRCRVLENVLTGLACSRSSDWTPFWVEWFVRSFDHAGLHRPRQADLLREVVRGAFRPMVFRASWRQWDGGTVINLAYTAHEARTLP